MMKHLILILSYFCQLSVTFHHHGPIARHASSSNRDVAAQEDMEYWNQLGQGEILRSLTEATTNTKKAKNVIIFVGDGMSIPTLTAARIFKGQINGNMDSAEKEYLTFERFPHLGHSKTYDTDYQIPDSASTASAMFSGVKTKFYSLGYDSSIDHHDVTSMLTAQEVSTILSWAQEGGKDTGLVTTARVTHATPAALYAHSFDRNWECDSKFEDDVLSDPPEGLHDIAYQLVRQEPGMSMKVILGGGFPAFFPKDKKAILEMEEKTGYDENWNCYRNDSLDLAKEWEENHPNSAVVRDRSSLLAVDPATTDYLLGLLGRSHVAFDDARGPEDPTLEDMALKAIDILKKNSEEGFFLLIEGGRIDHAHHDVWARRALSETVAMDKTVEAVMAALGDQLDETLIVVTADHSHTMSINGYAARGNDIAGLSTEVYDDDLPYPTISYANGVNYYYHNIPDGNGNVTRRVLTQEEVEDIEFRSPSAAYKKSESHGGDDVAIFATGPWSHLFHTTHEQTHIAHVMAFSSCLGFYTNEAHCK